MNILDQLAREACRLRVGRKLPPADPIPWEKVRLVQDDFRYLLEQPGVTITAIAEAMGDLSRGPLSRFRNAESRDAFGGDLDKTTRRVNQFMETLGRRKLAAAVAPPQGYVETEVARRILLVVSKTIELGGMGVITSDAGRGKTLTLKTAATIHPGSLYLRVRRDTRTPKGLMSMLAEALSVRVVSRTSRVAGEVIAKLGGKGRALLIDEAHQLTHEAFEVVRDLHDEAGCPIILAGTVQLTEAVDDNDLFYGQFSSRIALRYDVSEDLRDGLGGDDPRPLHSIDEVRQLYESDQVKFTDDGRLLLTKIANLPGLGGLRLCAKIAQVATAAANGELVSARLILDVIRMLHGKAFAVGRIEPAIERCRLRSA